MKLHRLLTLVLVTVIPVCISVDCPPDCSGVPDGEKRPSVTDCSAYYICYFGEPTGPFFCDAYEEFDPNILECSQIPSNPSCVPTSCPGSGETCLFDCVEAGPENVADPYECNAYFSCSLNRVQFCPSSDPFFDGVECQTDGSKCCSCQPYCPTAHLNGGSYLVPDPTDCTAFYICNEAGIPTIHSQCSYGHFDPVLQECSPTYPCFTTCYNVVGSDGCIDRFTCLDSSRHPKCPQRCSQEYYNCYSNDLGQVISPIVCENYYVFNPDKGTCTPESECSYPPPGDQQVY